MYMYMHTACIYMYMYVTVPSVICSATVVTCAPEHVLHILYET